MTAHQTLSPTDIRLTIRGNGYDPVPTAGKSPKMLNWRQRCRDASEEEIKRWAASEPACMNTGVLCDHLAGVDIDVLDPVLCETIERLVVERLGPTPLRRTGRAPKVLLVYRVAHSIKKMQTPALQFTDDPDEKDTQLEILGAGQQFVGFGVHPDTRQPYRWDDESPLTFNLADLPEVTEDDLRQIVAEAEAILRAAGAAPRKQERKQAESQTQEPPKRTASERALASASERGAHDDFDFWKTVNNRALANLDAWVPQLMPQAKRGTDGGYRVPSRNLSRNLEEDLSFHPSGIKDWGVHDMGDPRNGGRTPIQVVLEYLPAQDASAAALWLCDRINIDPKAIGWRGGKRASDGRHAVSGAAGKPVVGRASPQAGGILIPIERDKLQIVQALGEAPAFPVEHLPTILRGAVEALEEHVQAPQALCAHSILSAAMLTAQGLADVEIRPIGSATPLSLFMLVVAVSGERKSACDNLALVPVAQYEASLRQEYEENAKAYRASKAAYDAEKRIVERDGKLTADERRNKLMHLVEPDAPLLPIMKAKEPNLEGLLNLLNNGRASIGIFTSEGGQFLGGHGMGEEARTRTVTGLSELWDSGSAQRVRAKETTFLQGRRVGISLAAQPKVASSLLSDELAKDQGFVGRFLVTMPDTTIGTRQIRETCAMDDARLLAFHHQCHAVLAHPLPLRDYARNEVAPPTLTLSREAWKVWQGLAQAIEDECGLEGMWVPVRSAALKMAENVARIAGILTVFENPKQATRAGVISGETMASAASIGLFYLKEALRLTGHSVLDPETRALRDLAV